MKLFTTKQKGDIGEKFTERYLKKNGYKILERNTDKNAVRLI